MRRGSRPHKPKGFWQTIDLTRPTTVIAREIGCTAAAVSYQKRMAGLSRPHRVNNGIWDDIDWRLSDRAIASDLKCSTRTVLNHRKRLGKM